MPPPFPRIDAHHHFWRPARGDYRWLRADVPALAPLLRSFEPAELQPLLAQHGVHRTVLVQAADSVAETDFLLGLAREHGFIAGVVGWADLADPASLAVLERWADQPRLKGLRPMLQDLDDADWIAHAPHPAVLQAMQRGGLRLDALVREEHLPALLRFVERWPGLPVIIDHAAKPALMAGPPSAAWQQGIAALARHPQVMCKLSGLLTEAAPGAGVAALQPVWQALLEHFGPQRLVWGSDWPVLTLAADYARWVELTEALCAGLPAAAQRALWHDNAERFYAL